MDEKSTVSNTEPRWQISTLISIASQYDSVLDVGCGTGNILKRIRSDYRIGIDACLKVILQAGRNANDVIFQCRDLLEIDFGAWRMFDFVYGVDIIEHFEKDVAIDLISKLESCASKRLVFFIPVGNHPQTRDDRGFNNHIYQTHRSVWHPKDMEDLGYKVWHYPDWHKNIKPPKEKGAMWCQKIIGEI